MTGTEIRVVASGSGEPGLDFVAAAFSQATGHRVRIAYDDSATPRDGVVVDVVIASSDAMERVIRPSGRVEEGGVSIGRMGLGVTVRRGAKIPDISVPRMLKLAALHADALLVTTHSSGLYVEGMLKKLGIEAQVTSRIERFANGPLLMDRLLHGTGAELGFLSINQVRRYEAKGLVLVGPLPAELQYYREFIAVPARGSAHKAVAWDFVNFCAGPGRPLLAANGFD